MAPNVAWRIGSIPPKKKAPVNMIMTNKIMIPMADAEVKTIEYPMI